MKNVKFFCCAIILLIMLSAPFVIASMQIISMWHRATGRVCW